MDTVADKLREARALVAKGWCQGYVAREADGAPVDYEDYCSGRKNPVSYCAYGALIKAYGNATEHWAALDYLGGEDVGSWNDAPDRTQADVLAAFDKAIELAEAGQ